MPLWFSGNTIPDVNRIVAQFSRHRELYRSIRNLLGFWPGNIHLYEQAFRHKSIARPIKGGFKNSNERLEFLGDAILGAAIAHYLFKKFPYRDEGFLTEMRSRIVSRSFLNHLAIRIGIDKLIRLDENARSNKSICGDTFEALLGAIYLDKGFDFTSKLIMNRIIRFHIDMDEIELLDNNYKSKLINWAQRNKLPVVFEAREEVSGKNQKLYFVKVLVDQKSCGEGVGSSKKQAEQAAAKMAADQLLPDDQSS
jgi:ribonuclease III